MKKIVWADNAETISNEIDSLVKDKVELICGHRGFKNITRLSIVAKTATKTGWIFVLLHPHEPSCNHETCTFYYHRKANNLLFFECKRVKKAGDYIGFEYPEKIYSYLRRRKHERVITHNDSSITFSLQQKQRIYNGVIHDISLQGAKILVNIPGEIEVGTELCHITLFLYTLSSKFKTVISVSDAEVSWSKCENSVTVIAGIKFHLHGKYFDDLYGYINSRVIENYM